MAVEAAEADGSVIRFSKTKDLEKIIAKLLKDKIEKNSISQKKSKKLLKETKNSSKIVENLISQYF